MTKRLNERAALDTGRPLSFFISGFIRPAPVRPVVRALMPATLRKYILLIAFVLSGFGCLGQTNVYSLTVRTRWTLGSYPAKFGLEGYRKDSAGYYILAADGTSVGGQMMGKPKDYTAVIVGPMGFSVPLPPLPVALLGAVIVGALCFLSAQIRRGFRRR
jgi:hypothetical protein